MNETPAYSKTRSAFRLLILISWVIIALIYFFFAKLIRHSGADKIPMQFHRACCRILPIRVKTLGTLSSHRPTLYVCNHISYLDIFVLGGVVPGCFIAKSEVAGWPVLGQMAKLQNTLFFERRGSRAQGQIQTMAEHLSGKGNLILFPEGTSTDGRFVQPFKSSLFHAAEVVDDVSIQPISVVYTTHSGEPMNQATRDYFAWYADMPFGSHFLKMAGMGKVEAKLVFHPPRRLADFDSRKACAEDCQREIAKALTKELEQAGVVIENDNSGYSAIIAAKNAAPS